MKYSYPAGDFQITNPIVLRAGDQLTGEGLQTRLFAPDGFDIVVIDASERLAPEATAMIKDLTLIREPNTPYSQDVNSYHSAIRVKSAGGFSISNVWAVGHGISYRFDIDAHNGYVNECWGTYTRCGVFLEDSGGVNITDIWLNNLYLLGEFSGQPNADDMIERYNYGIYQRSNTVGDMNILGCTVLRFNEGICLEGSGNDYNHNLRIANTTIDQCNGGLYLKNFQDSILLGNHVMCYARRSKYIRRIVNCKFTPEKYAKYNIFRGNKGLL